MTNDKLSKIDFAELNPSKTKELLKRSKSCRSDDVFTFPIIDILETFWSYFYVLRKFQNTRRAVSPSQTSFQQHTQFIHLAAVRGNRQMPHIRN